jgi:hypothetical protein
MLSSSRRERSTWSSHEMTLKRHQLTIVSLEKKKENKKVSIQSLRRIEKPLTKFLLLFRIKIINLFIITRISDHFYSFKPLAGLSQQQQFSRILTFRIAFVN